MPVTQHTTTDHKGGGVSTHGGSLTPRVEDLFVSLQFGELPESADIIHFRLVHVEMAAGANRTHKDNISHACHLRGTTAAGVGAHVKDSK